MRLANFLHDLTMATKQFDMDYDCFSKGQLESKEWLVNELIELQEDVNLNTVYILCGWYGILAALLFLNFEIEKIRSFDIDKKCEKVADQINKSYSSQNWRFKAITQDIFDINFEKHSWQCWSNKNNRMSYPITDIPTTIINTSCEHTPPSWFQKVPGGRFLILQSNDFFAAENHINCVTSLDEFYYMYPLSEIYYQGEKKLEKYSRYMLMGIK